VSRENGICQVDRAGYGAVRLRARGDQHLMPASYIEFIPSSADRTITVMS